MPLSLQRPERLRASPALRNLVRESRLDVEDLVLPIFLNSKKKGSVKIGTMPGVSQWSVEASLKFFEAQYKLGIRNFILFGIVDGHEKSFDGAAAWAEEGPVPKALELYKKKFPDTAIMADACFCEYTDHGHCGVFFEKGKDFLRDREKTLINLAKASVVYAEAGADIIAPSGMIDGMVQTIRSALDKAQFKDKVICSYAVKYASQFYGPFRDAAENAPKKGTNRRAYQMDIANRREALWEVDLDLSEGAEMILVKPATTQLDIVRDVVNHSQVPVGAYQVSGEYSMIKAASMKGWLDEDAAFSESLLAIKRAGAQFMISYWAPRAAELLAKGKFGLK